MIILTSSLFRTMRVLLAIVGVIVWGGVVTAGTQPKQVERPRLGVVIVVDQMRYDYLTRYESAFTGGFARLQKQGQVYAEAYHDHAATETAVGHATISTGCYPSHHGIVGNEWFDQHLGRLVKAVEDTTVIPVGGSGKKSASPHNLLRPAIGDWLKKQSPKSMVYAVALKDRAAVLMGGLHPDGAFWYDKSTGNFVTSKYYNDTLLNVVRAFNAERQVDRFREEGWTRLMPDSVYLLSHEDDFKAENDGIHTMFPHPFDSTSDSSKYFTALYSTPFADEMTIALAKRLVGDRGLGKDDVPDLLLISCSSADAIGHGFGPNSQEEEDYYLRLDGYLDTLFTYLDSTVGTDRYFAILTADHGVMLLPEDLERQGLTGGRIWIGPIVAETKAIGDSVKAQLHLASNPIADCGYDVILNYAETRKQKIADSVLQNAVVSRMRKMSHIEDVITASELESSRTPDRAYLDLFRNSYHPVRHSDLFIRFTENYLVTSSPYGTSHGTPYGYDRHVPIVLLYPGVTPGTIGRTVRTVDIAPTIADLLGIKKPKDADGVSLLR